MMAAQQGFSQAQRSIPQAGAAVSGFAAHYPVGTSVTAGPPVAVSSTNNSIPSNSNGTQSTSAPSINQEDRQPPVIDLKVIAESLMENRLRGGLNKLACSLDVVRDDSNEH